MSNIVKKRTNLEKSHKNALSKIRRLELEKKAMLSALNSVLISDTFSATARLIFDTCKNLLGATCGYVALLNDVGDENEVLFLDAGGLKCTVDPALPMPIRGLREIAYESCKAVYDNNFLQSRWMKLMPRGHCDLYNVLFSPLVLNGKAVGLLGLANKDGGFTDEDLVIAEAFGKFASVALNNNQIMESLREKEKEAYLANKSKSQFLANMSHEIRTPMNAIIGFSEILADEELTDEQESYVNTIHNSGKHLLELINDILDFSKIEAGKMEIEMNEHSLEKLLTTTGSMVETLASEKNLEFKIRKDQDLPAEIRTDSDRLRQCLINLLNNAIKFTEEGHLYLNVSLEYRNDQPYIRFSVEDTGIGIPPEKQEKIFESFSQADGSISRKYGGTGLGLAITKQLTELMGGELTLTSEEGKGSVFSLVIPAGVDVTKHRLSDSDHIADKAVISKEKTKQPEFSGNILVAEDAKTNQMLMNSLLGKMGLTLTIAEDGCEAVGKALNQDFDLIFMDIQMPNMNGYEATQALKKKGITTPIVALTANAIKGDYQKCIEAGCDDYLSKPIDRKKLVEILHKYLTSKVPNVSQQVDSIKSQ